MDENLYFHIGIDAEPLEETSPCGGFLTWEESERVIKKWLELFRRRNLVKGAGFYLTPEAAKAHTELFKDLKEEGFEIGIQPNVPAFRYPKYKYDLGYYDEEMQRQIIGEAIEDFYNALGFKPETYTPCCGSRNEHTYLILIEYGIKQIRVPVPGRYFSDRPDRLTIGYFPYPHWASSHHLIPGCLPLFVIPITGKLMVKRDKWVPDLRPEREPTEETRESYKEIIDENIEIMKMGKVPIKSIAIGTHNTRHVHFENIEFVIDYIYEKAEREGLKIVPIQPPKLRQIAEKLREKDLKLLNKNNG